MVQKQVDLFLKPNAFLMSLLHKFFINISGINYTRFVFHIQVKFLLYILIFYYGEIFRYWQIRNIGIYFIV